MALGAHRSCPQIVSVEVFHTSLRPSPSLCEPVYLARPCCTPFVLPLHLRRLLLQNCGPPQKGCGGSMSSRPLAVLCGILNSPATLVCPLPSWSCTPASVNGAPPPPQPFTTSADSNEACIGTRQRRDARAERGRGRREWGQGPSRRRGRALRIKRLLLLLLLVVPRCRCR